MYTSLPQTPNNPTPQETSNKKREVVLGVILVITLIIGARYLMTRNNPNSSSSANLQNPILEENEPVYSNQEHQ